MRPCVIITLAIFYIKFNKSNTTKIDFEDGLELDNFIEALIQLQHYHRVNTGVWRGMK